MKLKPTDLSTSSSVATLVFEALRKAIIEGDLATGDPLRQDEIARTFNTSRIPVREAISRLEEQGLVTTRRFKGAVVSGLSPKDTAEIFDLRALLEPEVLRNAVPRMTSDHLVAARQTCDAFSASKNPADWAKLNRGFHEAIYAASDLSFFKEVIQNAINRTERQVREQLIRGGGMGNARREHEVILNACERGDADLAAGLVRDHILATKKSLLAQLPEAD